MNQVRKIISWVNYQLYATAFLMCLLVAGAIYLLVSTFSTVFFLPTLGAIVGFGIMAYKTQLFQNKRNTALQLIHQKLNNTEYSLQLLDISKPNIAEQLQLERLLSSIETQPIPNVISPKLGIYLMIFLAALGINFAYPFLKKNIIAKPTEIQSKKNSELIIQNSELQTAKLTIIPPSYTKFPIRVVSDLNASAISGSILKWQLNFTNSTDLVVKLVNNRAEELNFKKIGDAFEYSDQLLSSGLYAFKAYLKDSLIYQSDYYRLEAIPDFAPKIEPNSKELYTFHYLKDPKNISIAAKISDDFLVNQAFIVATLARGSGENVKFREVKFPISQANFKEATVSKNIDLKALNFSPGDELYYYWAAIDNKRPEPNFTKSDTYFIVYKDTANVEEAELSTMAMNIVPEYFRSQRQIIIDTEKLIAKRKKTPPQEFNSASNEIGFDQKALRLRYGQYLGEEFENTIGGANALPSDVETDGDFLKGYVHDHDGGEHETESSGHKDEHQHEGSKQEGKDPVAELLADYVHSHDDGEANTYYEQSTRSLLKMSLEQMWQSELHLRLYEPEKALPFEKKALEYLKLAQQKARTFVKKTSYDPPPIKEKEKRLTGELTKFNEAFSSEKKYSQQQLQNLIAEVLGIIDAKIGSQKLNFVQKQKLLKLENDLSGNTINNKISNLSILSLLQKIINDKELSANEKSELKTKLYQIVGSTLPNKNSTGNKSYSSEKSLEKAFWKNLQK
ncbi:hypothetical protein [Emticicia sp. SJ17W-69]|uniref:hypothetical protein n=1 Tax=Emticicia sp. SJ17W-69 TaxID=3421657 RepID=UPI003EC1114C